jgi:hypothetical protein
MRQAMRHAMRQAMSTPTIECPREQDVLDAVAFGRWNGGEGLRAHVAACAICADLVEVARALHDDRESVCRDARVPSPGLVWWRATIRARAEAARTAAQPITVWQGIAGACAVGLAGGLAATAWRALHGLVSNDVSIDLAAASSLALQYGLPIMLALGACLVLAPLALYITLADD